MNEIKVGDVVAWPLVPNRALVRMSRPLGWPGREFYLQHDDGGWCVYVEGDDSWSAFGRMSDGSPDEPWSWIPDGPDGETCTIIALNVPTDATAEHLRELAERFEVREAMLSWTAGERSVVCQREAAWGMLDEVADRLYRARWRKGMTAEDAARLLADIPDGCPDGVGCGVCFDED